MLRLDEEAHAILGNILIIPQLSRKLMQLPTVLEELILE
jgi:hypothetical protein